MKKYALILCFIATGCVSTPPPNYVPIRKNLSFPEVGKVAQSALGEDMLRQGFYTETDGFETKQVNNIRGYKISSGFYPQISEDKNYTYHRFQMYSSTDGSGFLISGRDLLGLPLPMPESIRVAKDKVETCLIVGGLARPACDTEVPYERVRRPAISERDFQQTLIYSGRVGSRIKLGYRESSGNTARPAFSNEAEYDLSSSNEIGYRGAKIRVITADNEHIEYIVLKNFNTN